MQHAETEAEGEAEAKSRLVLLIKENYFQKILKCENENYFENSVCVNLFMERQYDN